MARDKNFKALTDKTKALQEKYPSAETQSLAKDAVVLMKKYEAVQNRGDKIADLLEASLEQHCQDSQVQEQRWISAAKEKVAWCGDTAGDRYSMEAKLATIKVSPIKSKTHSSYQVLQTCQIHVVLCPQDIGLSACSSNPGHHNWTMYSHGSRPTSCIASTLAT